MALWERTPPCSEQCQEGPCCIYLYVEALDNTEFDIRLLFDATGKVLIHTLPDCMVPDVFWERASTTLLGYTFEPSYPEYYAQVVLQDAGHASSGKQTAPHLC